MLILELLKEKPDLTVEKIASLLEISESTVRRAIKN